MLNKHYCADIPTSTSRNIPFPFIPDFTLADTPDYLVSRYFNPIQLKPKLQ